VNKQLHQTSRALHVLFLAEGNGRAAQLAAHWARALAGDSLHVEAADFDGMDSTPALNGAQASLVVVIHAAGDPWPVLVHSSGGRIDWHLEANAITEDPFELISQLRQHVMRLLSDLGIPQTHSEVSAIQPADSLSALAFPISLLASTCSQGISEKVNVLAA